MSLCDRRIDIENCLDRMTTTPHDSSFRRRPESSLAAPIGRALFLGPGIRRDDGIMSATSASPPNVQIF